MESESFRSRIAQLVAGKPTKSVGDAFALADAVIAALGLRREDMNEWAVLAEGFRGHRYVTEWEPNECIGPHTWPTR